MKNYLKYVKGMDSNFIVDLRSHVISGPNHEADMSIAKHLALAKPLIVNPSLHRYSTSDPTSNVC